MDKPAANSVPTIAFKVNPGERSSERGTGSDTNEFLGDHPQMRMLMSGIIDHAAIERSLR
jgi:hypothetical protein